MGLNNERKDSNAPPHTQKRKLIGPATAFLGENGAMSTFPTLEEETISICQDLIRIPSVNFGEGKGDEKAVAEYVVASLAEV